MARLLLIALVALSLLGGEAEANAQPERQAPQAVQEYGDWSVACDNASQCVAVSVSRAFVQRIARAEPGDLAQPKLWVRRDAGPLAVVRVILDTRVWGEATGEGPSSLDIRTECDNACLTRSFSMTRLEPGLYELAAADAEAFLIESQYGQRAVTRFPDGTKHGIVSTDGLSAALRWIDQTQQREGTMSAVVAYGETPASSVPPALERPLVPVVRAIADHEFALAARPELGAWQQQHCSATATDADLPVQQFLLGNGQSLWALPCGSGPYREVRLWLVESEEGEVALHRLPRPDVAAPAEPPLLWNSRFDMQSGMLTSNSGGLCGWQRRWAWTGRAFAMIDSIEMPACHDILPSNWLQTYRAVPD